MTSCSDIEAKMTPYVDGEMSASEAAAVDRHLEICDPCRERSRVERAARTLVTDRASRLSALAPASLTARCEAAAASPFAKGRPRGRRRVASRRVLGAHRCRWRLRLSCSSPQRSRSCASADSPTRSWLQNSPGITPRASRWPETTDRRPTSRTWNSRSSGRSDGTRVSRLGCRRRGSNCSRLAVAPTTMGRWPTCSVVWTGSPCRSSCCHRAHGPMRTSRSSVSA